MKKVNTILFLGLACYSKQKYNCIRLGLSLQCRRCIRNFFRPLALRMEMTPWEFSLRCWCGLCTSHCLSSEATVPLLNLFPSQQKALCFWLAALLQRSRSCCSTCKFAPWNKGGFQRGRVLPNLSKHRGLYLLKLSLPSEASKPGSPN